MQTMPSLRRNNRKVLVLAGLVVLLVIQALTGYLAARYSPTELEPALLASGVAQITQGRFDVYAVNPPLVKALCAFPATLIGYNTDWSALSGNSYERTERKLGRDFLIGNNDSFWAMLFCGRLVCSLFLPCGVCAAILLTRDIADSRTSILILSPGLMMLADCNFLGHAALITNDVPATAGCIVALLFFRRWLWGPCVSNALMSGCFLGIAQLIKLSMIILVPVLAAVWLLHVILDARTPKYSPPPMWHLFLILIFALYVVNFGYAFEEIGMPIGDFSFGSSVFRDIQSRLVEYGLGGIPLCLPECYVKGLDIQSIDFEHFHIPSFLCEEWQYDQGWWYYYLFCLAFKVPHSTQIVCMSGIVYAVYRLIALRYLGTTKLYSGIAFSDVMLLFLPAMTLLVIASCQYEFSIHFRYIFPCIPLFSILGVLCILDLMRSENIRVLVFYVIALCSFITLSHFPHCITYFNELSGGSGNGWKLVLGSSYDWGQDGRTILEQLSRRGIELTDVYVHEHGFHHLPSIIGKESSGRGNGDKYLLISANHVFRGDERITNAVVFGRAIRLSDTTWLLPL